MARQQILLVDDDAKLLRVLTLRLEAEGYDVAAAANADEALRRLAESHPEMALIDLRMPQIDGIELLAQIHHKYPSLPIAILSAHSDVPEVVRATHAGAVDFLIKPVDRDDLIACIERHIKPGRDLTAPWAPGIVTRSPLMRTVLDDAQRIAHTESAVLITGATGTGKEVLARAVHAASRRGKAPFVAINCAAVPAELLESELFGHRKGSFTGAHADHPGLFRAAHGGTVFLDEIGDMPGGLQVKLLRVLQEREVRPVGETRTIPVDIRVISATHCDLETRVGDGRFREDLFYRLNVVRLRLPSLEERREDIAMLVAHRLEQLRASGAPRRIYAANALELLVTAAWPGNVRQLFNVVEQNVALASGHVINAAVVQKGLGIGRQGMASFDEARDEFARNYLRQLLELSAGNISRAARLARRNRTDFYKLLNRYKLDPAQFKHMAESAWTRQRLEDGAENRG